MTPDLPELSPPGTNPHRENAGRQPGLRTVWVMLALVLLLALFVVLALPRLAKQETVLQPAVTEPASSTVPGVEEDVASLARHNAEQALQAYLRLRAEPGLADAERWAQEESGRAFEQAEQGDGFIGRRSYNDAEAAYRLATDTLQQLLDTRPRRFQTILQRAYGLLEENKPDEALADFELALLMEPADSGALAGQARARVRADVLSYVDVAKVAEQEQHFEDALQAYARAVALDPEYQPAVSALQALESRLQDVRYQDALGTALSALEKSQFQTSAGALKEAKSIHPDSQEVKDLQLRLHSAQQAGELASLRSQARRSVAAENWQVAEGLYRKALAIDSGTAFAIAGQEKARRRIRLHGQLDHYLDDPERLYSPEPLKNATRLLSSTGSIPVEEPLLKGKIDSLAQHVEQAKTPVDLLLLSDDQTSVSIYHVGQFGHFSEKRLSLLPGRYTVVGSRSGYRDVREIITVLPGKPLPPLMIRCEEPV